MKILHIHAPDATDESQDRFVDLLSALAESGIRQCVFMGQDTSLEGRLQGLNIPLHTRKFGGMFDLRPLQIVRQVAQSFGPHVIQTHTPDSAALAAKLQTESPHVGFSHADAALNGKITAASDLVLSVDYPRPDAAAEGKILPVPPLVLDCGKTLSPPPPSPGEQPKGKHLAGTILHLSQPCGLDVIFQAIREIPDLHVKIAGDGPDRKFYEEKARKQAVHDRVHFTGLCTDKADFLKTLDLCLIPRRAQGIDRLTLEAWSCGVCVLSAMPDGQTPITHGQNGWRVDPDDVPHWRTALLALLKDEGRDRATLAAAGRKTYETAFSPDKIIRSYLQAYETALRIKT